MKVADAYVVELDGWVLNICYADGFSVWLNFVAYAGDGAEEGRATLMIGDEFSVSSAGAVHELRATKPADLGPLFSLLRGTIERAAVAADGTLQIAVGTGVVEVPPNPQFEAWDLSTPAFKAVCVPGGELAIWDSDRAPETHSTT
jgi:Family of unknown function (DUF6188)